MFTPPKRGPIQGLKDATLKCKVHPKYQGIYKPRGSEKFPDGCKDCWAMYWARRGGTSETTLAPEIKPSASQAALADTEPPPATEAAPE